MSKFLRHFREPGRVEKMRKIFKSWLGTRYLHMGTHKGDKPGAGGADCTKFLGLCLVEYGALSQLKEREYYSKDWYIHGTREVVLESFDFHIENFGVPGFHIGRQQIGNDTEFFFGDIVGFATTASGLTNHTAGYLNEGLMIHCLQKLGVSIVPFDFEWLPRATYLWRLYDIIEGGENGD